MVSSYTCLDLVFCLATADSSHIATYSSAAAASDVDTTGAHAHVQQALPIHSWMQLVSYRAQLPQAPG